MNQQNAERIIKSTDEIFHEISKLLDIVNSSCQGDERKEFQHAIGVALGELDLEILSNVYKQFPNLMPPERK
jgi:hypothetical protein